MTAMHSVLASEVLTTERLVWAAAFARCIGRGLTERDAWQAANAAASAYRREHARRAALPPGSVQ